jgi:cysteine desulfurase/selenocysteine lyase
MSYDVEAIRAQFPILQQTVRGKPLVYLDNAASVQKPQAVIDTIAQVYSEQYANIHRGVHWMSEQTTIRYDKARQTVASFINAANARQIVFTRGATESINLVAYSYLEPLLSAGDEIVVTELEHHANIVPWQLLCQRKGAVLKVLPILDNGELDLAQLPRLLTTKTKMLAVAHVSNALGTINPISDIIAQAKAQNIPILIDGAQAVPHLTVDIQALDPDFYVFSGHKIYGPSGIGALYAKVEHLEKMQPYQSGGDMIASVTFEHTDFAEYPQKFEAGTPYIEGAIGFAAAIDWMNQVGIENIAAHELDLLEYATAQFRQVKGLTIIGDASEKSSVLSFLLDNAHPHDIGTMLDQHGVAIRTGQHCAQPLMERLGIPATARASFAAYNTRAEVDALVSAIVDVNEMFG